MTYSKDQKEDKEYCRRRKIRRVKDRDRDEKVLHAAKHLVEGEALVNKSVDTMLEVLGLTREELNG